MSKKKSSNENLDESNDLQKMLEERKIQMKALKKILKKIDNTK